MADSKIYHCEEVSNHNVIKNRWFVISGRFMMLIRFMDKHPGGNEVLLAATGKDATDDLEDIGHSTLAGDMMIKHYIGEVDSSTVAAKRNSVPPQQEAYNADKGSDFVIKILQFLVPILILGLVFTVQQTPHQSRFRIFFDIVEHCLLQTFQNC
ncbi:cytochrome b5-like [Musa acuminata AAA Group]|uniref:cytochrome b5-like n=1 Tax=Musa acuminata AAA Group TaxID=214697 RepID=UPI0031D04B48